MEDNDIFEKYDRENSKRKNIAEWLGIIGFAGFLVAIIAFIMDFSPYICAIGFMIGLVGVGTGWGLRDMTSGPAIPDGEPEDGWF